MYPASRVLIFACEYQADEKISDAVNRMGGSFVVTVDKFRDGSKVYRVDTANKNSF